MLESTYELAIMKLTLGTRMSKHGSYSIASRKNNCGNFFFVFYGERGSVLALLHSYSKYGSFKIEIKTVII